MTFVFPLLLGGLVLAGIPVLLHFIVRQQPKVLPFPAFRFLLQRRTSNRHKLRLRHLLLLALRVLLIGAMCLALARPQLLVQGLNLNREKPIAAVLVFDTSASMAYQNSEGTRLAQAKRRALELLDACPDGSRYLVIDSADAGLGVPEGPWLRTADELRKKIADLKVRPANAALAPAAERGLRRLAELLREDAQAVKFHRLLCAFSDQTPASWNPAQTPRLLEALDQVPPVYEGLLQARGLLGPLAAQLPALRANDPGARDLADQSFADAAAALAEELRAVGPQDLPPQGALAAALQSVRKLTRELHQQLEPATQAEVPAERSRALDNLRQLERNLSGVHRLYVDVGIAQPVDLGLVQLEFPRGGDGKPRTSFAEGEPWVLHAVLQAVGKDLSNTLICQVGEHKVSLPVEVKAGQRLTLPVFDTRSIRLKPGEYAVEAKFETSSDALPWNNHRFATFAIQEKKKVIVLADELESAALAVSALESLGTYEVQARRLRDQGSLDLTGAQAVYLIGAARPAESTWAALEAFVQAGGGLAIMPAGDDLSPGAYNQAAVVPAEFLNKVTAKEPGVMLGWPARAEDYEHPFLEAFGQWRKNPIYNDFIAYPRRATAYWEVRPRQARVLLRYQDAEKRPAILVPEAADAGDAGKVMLFTTTFDQRLPAWNNYDAKISWFYLAVFRQCTRYLCGEDRGRDANGLLGGSMVVLLPPTRTPQVLLLGPESLEKLNAETAALTLKELRDPGNYQVQSTETGTARRTLARFSMNVPPEECDLARVPLSQVEQVFGAGAVITLDRQADLLSALQGHWSEPIEIFPWLMLALLLLLVFENLLANKFYRQPAETQAGSAT